MTSCITSLWQNQGKKQISWSQSSALKRVSYCLPYAINELLKKYYVIACFLLYIEGQS